MCARPVAEGRTIWSKDGVSVLQIRENGSLVDHGTTVARNRRGSVGQARMCLKKSEFPATLPKVYPMATNEDGSAEASRKDASQAQKRGVPFLSTSSSIRRHRDGDDSVPC